MLTLKWLPWRPRSAHILCALNSKDECSQNYLPGWSSLTKKHADSHRTDWYMPEKGSLCQSTINADYTKSYGEFEAFVICQTQSRHYIWAVEGVTHQNYINAVLKNLCKKKCENRNFTYVQYRVVVTIQSCIPQDRNQWLYCRAGPRNNFHILHNSYLHMFHFHTLKRCNYILYGSDM